MTSDNITELLAAWRSGDASAQMRVSTLAYDRLKALAVQRFARESSAENMLQPTALVHEALMRLWGADATPNDRQHLFALASMHMRSILFDHARARLAQKRGGSAFKVTLGVLAEGSADSAQDAVDFMALEQAIQRLESEDPRTAKMLCLHYFGGLDQREIAEQMLLSLTTVERGLRFARAWLKDALG